MRYVPTYCSLVSLVVTVRLLLINSDNFIYMALATIAFVIAGIIVDAMYSNAEAIIDAIYANADRTAAERQANTKHKRRYAR